MEVLKDCRKRNGTITEFHDSENYFEKENWDAFSKQNANPMTAVNQCFVY